MSDTKRAPNHHADHPPFRGIMGIVAALSMAGGRQADAQLAVDTSGLAAGDVALDIGCGPGTAVRRAARLGAHAIGVDPAPVMLRTARLLTRSKNATYRRGSAEQLPVRGREVHAAWSVATVHHWRDIDEGLREVRRVLVPGGRFVAIERLTHAGSHGLAGHGWTEEQAQSFAQYCAANGFVDIRVERGTGARGPAMVVVAATPCVAR